MSTLWQDLRYGSRMLWKAPGFTLVAIISLAIGIGANTAIFSLVNAALLRPLPGVKDAARLVDVYATAPNGDSFVPLSHPDYLYYRDHNDVFDGLLASSFAPFSLNASGQPERVFGMIVSGNYFDVLGVRPTAGRFFLPEEDRTPGTHPVAVISYAMWQQRFGGSRDVIGRQVTLNNHSFTVIGVAPENLRGPFVYFMPAVYVPAMMQAQALPGRDLLGDRNAPLFSVRGRLRADVSIERAQAALAALAKQLETQFPETNRGEAVKVRSMSTVPGEVRAVVTSFMATLMGLVGLVLVVACANVAGMFIARASTRRKEFAIRAAIGAGRGRLIRQLLTENALLFIGGGIAGTILATWIVDLLLAFRPSDSLFTIDLSLDWRVLSFTLLVSLATGIIFGLAPALGASKPDLIPVLKDTVAGSASQSSRLRSFFVTGQIAISLVLLIAAGLFVRSLRNAAAIDPGFNPEGVQTATIDLRSQGYTEERGREFFRRFTERVETLPGVAAVSLASMVPLNGMNRLIPVRLEGHEPPPGQDAFRIDANTVDRNYLRTLEVPLRRGRDFLASDTKESPPVAIVNETMARTYFAGDAVGKRFTRRASGDGEEQTIEIVGVAEDGRYQTLGEDARPYIYLPFAQTYSGEMILHIRAGVDTAGVLAAVRREVQRLDPNLPLTGVMPMTEQIGFSLIPIRLAGAIVGVLGVLGLGLASIGIYGIISYAVAERTREIGIRMALGAQRGDVLRIVMRQGLVLTAIGVIAGLSGAYILTRFLSSLLYGISATDPITFTGIALLFSIIALLASYIPARRATKVDPMVALRYE